VLDSIAVSHLTDFDTLIIGGSDLLAFLLVS